MYMFCEGYLGTFITVVNTLSAMVGGFSPNPNSRIPGFNSHVPLYMEKANLEFLQETMSYTLEKRNIPELNDYNESLIQSGDLIATFRLDGIIPFIMLGTGSYAGHSAMALWFEDGLYILESITIWFWPGQGIQRTKYSEWIH